MSTNLVISKKPDRADNKSNSPEPDCGNKNKKVRCKTLIIHGEKYRTTFTKKFQSRKKWEKPDVKKVMSYIPGTVTKVFVEKGKTVKKGDKMLILEAMKMRNTINYPMSGEIKKVNVKTGDIVPKNYILIEYK